MLHHDIPLDKEDFLTEKKLTFETLKPLINLCLKTPCFNKTSQDNSFDSQFFLGNAFYFNRRKAANKIFVLCYKLTKIPGNKVRCMYKKKKWKKVFSSVAMQNQ